MEKAAKAKAKARQPTWEQIVKVHTSPRVATVPSTVRDFCPLQIGSLEPATPPQDETPTRRSRAPKPKAPVPLNGMTGLPSTLAPMMSTLAFSAGPPGSGALPAYEDAQASLLIAAEDGGVPLPKHALLTSKDWTIVVHYAEDSQDLLKILREILNMYNGARLSPDSLSELIAEHPTSEWKVGTCVAAARQVAKLKTVASEITMENWKALAGAITRLVDAAAEILPKGDAFVENFITKFYAGCENLAPPKIDSGADASKSTASGSEIPTATETESAPHTQTDQQENDARSEEPVDAMPPVTGKTSKPQTTADPTPAKTPTRVASQRKGSVVPRSKDSHSNRPGNLSTTATTTEQRTNRTRAPSQRMLDMQTKKAKLSRGPAAGDKGTKVSRN